MKKIQTIIFITFMVAFAAWSQAQEFPALPGKEPAPLTPRELFVLSNIPELKLPDSYKGPNAPLLPVSVDNSQKKYFRAITQQYGYECGQSAGIAFNFTYEIDRLRDLAANQPQTTYPTHFTWDFLNEGDNYTGASFFDSWEIVRACGNMNVEEYGGTLGFGGCTRWITGYNMYYSGMHNRITSVKAVRADTPEGLLALKYWMYDHLEGAGDGGVGNIYGSYFCTPSTELPPNTPEAGKYVQTYWGSYASHAYTVCGYNDSIRFDFNNDDQYTNNIDINGDGVVDMHDWEIGGLKFANGYAGTGCSNQGFCYTMYKNVADAIEYGGIWNHTIYVLDVKETCSPQMTMKVTIKHTARNKLKVTTGISTDLGATIPSFVQEYPIFNFQGGDYYMQGGGSEADKTIEFGLDLTPLLNQVNSGEPVKYFLQVQERDPSGSDAGEIVKWSLMDYTGGIPIETIFPATHITIQNNATTRLGQNYTIDFEKPEIVTDTLPPAVLYQPYDLALTADGGTPPYLWDVKFDYPENTGTAPFPMVTAQQLALTSNDEGYAVKTIDFDFPFYDQMVNEIHIYANGFIVFDDQPYHRPYQVDDMLLFRQTSIIAPFLADLAVYPSAGQGIWYEGDANYAIFRWKASISNMQGSTNLNFAVKLFPDGTIEYYYGDMIYPFSTTWTGGLSGGDNKNYQFSLFNNATSIPVNTLDQFLTCGFPSEMSITEEGHLTGTPTKSYLSSPIKVIVTDNNNLSSVKTLPFNSYGLFLEPVITSGGDSLIEYGETAEISLQLNNIGDQAFQDVTVSIFVNDPYITLVDSIIEIPVINGWETLVLPGAFSFDVGAEVPDKHPFQLTFEVTSDILDFDRTLNLTAHAPVLSVINTHLLDGDNGMLDPGESADILITYKNWGSAKASSINVLLNSLDTCLTINPNQGNIQELLPDSARTLTFRATASQDASFQHLYPLVSELTANHGFYMEDTLYLLSGEIIEDFETANFDKFPWFFSGQWPWVLQSAVVVEGDYAARSGVITDNAESAMHLSVEVLTGGEISFWKYVSCEHDGSGNLNYDYLTFKIDGFEMGRWDGIVPWNKVSFPVSAGHHIFSWVYHKDYSVSTGWDGCIIDVISFPLIAGAIPELSVGPLSFEKSLITGQSVVDSIQLVNLGGGILDYSVMVFDTTAANPVFPGENMFGSSLTCNTAEFVPGQAFNWSFTAHNNNADAEGIKHIKLDFPPGVNVGMATNFSGGSLGELVLQVTPGMGKTLNWHGETSEGLGALQPGETATASITGAIDGNLMDDLFMVYNLEGDSNGSSPHLQAGHVKITNTGLGNDWLTIDNPTGSLTHDQTATVTFTIDATGLEQKTYRCSLVARDFYNNKFVIPVTLHVSYPVGVETEGDIQVTRLTGNYPNPFAGETSICFELDNPSSVTVAIFNMQGVAVRTLAHEVMAKGPGQLVWDGTDNHGNAIPAGIYTCRMTTPTYRGTIKLICIR